MKMIAMNKLKIYIKKLIPVPILSWILEKKLNYKYNGMDLQSVFSNIYENNTWGGKRGEYCSGSGTTNENTKLYIEKLQKFIFKNEIKTIVEIGCGDYSIMEKVLADSNVTYIGCDIVPPLIEHNNKTFGNEHIKFLNLNAVDDVLPAGELCIIRQVLQHLNNQQILAILEKTKSFAYVLITEHIAIKPKVKNIDKKAGPDIRVYKESGVYLDHSPFDLKTEEFLTYKEDVLLFDKPLAAAMKTSLVINKKL